MSVRVYRCQTCDVGLPTQSGPGQPRRYCSESCSRVARRATLARRVRLGRALESLVINGGR